MNTPESVEAHVAAIVGAVREYPREFLDYPPVTPFATVRELMGCPPPWRIFWRARRAWFFRLEIRVRTELERQARFVAAMAAERVKNRERHQAYQAEVAAHQQAVIKR